MDDGDLRARLARLDPARRLEATGPAESPTAHEIRERVMQTMETSPPVPASRRRRPLLVAGAAAGVAAVAVAAAVLTGGGDAPRVRKASTTLALKAPGGDFMSACMAFEVAFLKAMPVAFAGTVVAVDAGEVTLDVDRWYRGGDADRVTVTQPGGAVAVALDGVEFTQGGRYLVVATDGTVSGCGFSGPVSAELEAAYAEAFPG